MVRREPEEEGCLGVLCTVGYGLLAVSSVVLLEGMSGGSGLFVFETLKYNKVPEVIAGAAGGTVFLAINYFVMAGVGLFDREEQR